MPIRQSMHKQAPACPATCPSCKGFAVQAPHSLRTQSRLQTNNKDRRTEEHKNANDAHPSVHA